MQDLSHLNFKSAFDALSERTRSHIFPPGFQQNPSLYKMSSACGGGQKVQAPCHFILLLEQARNQNPYPKLKSEGKRERESEKKRKAVAVGLGVWQELAVRKAVGMQNTQNPRWHSRLVLTNQIPPRQENDN